MYPDDRVVRFVSEEFLPVRVHVRDDAAEFQRLGERYGAHWTPAILVLDRDGTERHRVEGFVPADELIAQLAFGLGRLDFQSGALSDAERRFRTVAERHPESEVAPEAMYWAGVARHKATGSAEHLAATERALREHYPDSTWARKASVWAS